jgi:hypothetical protein
VEARGRSGDGARARRSRRANLHRPLMPQPVASRTISQSGRGCDSSADIRETASGWHGRTPDARDGSGATSDGSGGGTCRRRVSLGISTGRRMDGDKGVLFYSRPADASVGGAPRSCDAAAWRSSLRVSTSDGRASTGSEGCR